MKDRLIIVAFYSPQGDDPWLNRLVATVDGPSCHVELAFPEGLFTESKNQHTMDAVCVYQGGNVEIVKKRYSKDSYKLFYVPVTSTQWTLMREKAVKICQAKIAFSQYAMIATFVQVLPTFAVVSDNNATCCSILTTQLLQHGGVLEKDINARRTTPSCLAKMLKKSTNVPSFCFGITPLRLESMRLVT
jgi:hypothetical protein